MKKLLALILTVVLCLCCLASCGSTHEENTWFSEEKLTNCLVADLPTVTKDYMNHNDEDIYISFTDSEFEAYAKSVYDYLLTQEYKYLGTRGEQKNTSAGVFTTYYFEPADELSSFLIEGDYIFVFSDGAVDENGDVEFNVLVISGVRTNTLEYGNKKFTYNTIISLRPRSETPLNGFYALKEEEHEHTGEWQASESTHYYQYTCGCPSPDIAELHTDYDENYICDVCEYAMSGHEHTYQNYQDEIGHGWSYICGCATPPNFAQHADGNGDGKCDDCEYVMNGNATNTGKVQTTIGEEAHLPQFMSLEVDKHNALSGGNTILVDVYMGYDILNQDGAAFSDIIVPEEDFENYTFVLEINYNNETRAVAIDTLNYFEEYRCNMYQGVVQYNKYNTIQLDTNKMTGKSYGFVNVELYMISNTDQRYWVSAQTLYYSVTESEIVFGLVSDPVANEGDVGIITKGWEYAEPSNNNT